MKRVSAPQTSVSVVIPAYNRAHTIAAAISSVLKQTRPADEIIVVDDGSTDSLREVIGSISNKTVRIVRQPNAGANTARNKGIDESTSTFVAMLDADDQFMPDHLESALDILQSSAENTVVFGRVLVDRGEGRLFLKPPRARSPGEHLSDYLLRRTGFVQTSTVVLRRDLAAKVRYRDGLPFGQDTDFAIRLNAAGARFVMKMGAAAIFRDTDEPDRISRQSDPFVRTQWLRSVREHITRRAYYADRGWFVAKGLMRRGYGAQAIFLYLRAVFTGCFEPRLAVRVLLQILLPPSLYRRAADRYISAKTSQQTIEQKLD